MPNANAHGAAATNGGQQPPKPVTIAFVLYPGFTALDIIGPFQVLASVPGHEAVFVAAEPRTGHRRHRPMPADRIGQPRADDSA